MARPATASVRLLTGEREPVRLATTANLATVTVLGVARIMGLKTIDGVLTEAGDRVLVKDQTDARLNGIYTASTGYWYRAADARTSRTMQKGTTVGVQLGTVNADRVFQFTTDNPVIGTSSIVLERRAGTGDVLSANNLSDLDDVNTARTNLGVGKVVTLQQFAVVGDGSDETTKIQTAMDTAAGLGWVLDTGKGTFGHTGLTIPDNLTMRGFSRWDSRFQKIAGTSSATLIGSDKINVDIQNVGFFGNGEGTGNDIAIKLTLTSALAAASERFIVKGCYFEGFRSMGWITIYNQHSSLPFENIDISDNIWISTADSIWAAAQTTLGVPCAMISISNDLAVSTSRINTVRVQNNYAYGKYVKQFYASWYGLHDIKITGNVIIGVGTDSGIQDTVGSYAIMVYDSSIGNSPTDVAISLNSIVGIRSIGIYCAGATKVRVLGNLISDQTDTTSTLPASAIAISACWDAIVQGNEAHDIAAVAVFISSVPVTGVKADLRQSVLVDSNLIVSAAIGVRVNGVIAASFPTGNEAFGIGVSGNRIYECLSGVAVQTFGATVRDLAITGNQIISSVVGSYGIRGIGFGGTPVMEVDAAIIANNTIRAAAYGINWTRANVGSTTIRANDIYGPVTGRGLEFPASTKMALIDNTFHDFTSGAVCMRSSTAEGVMQGTTFVNCSTAFTTDSSADMGRAAPTWTPANREDFVQGINQVEIGTGAKYYLMGWRFDGTAWRECRSLTGNMTNQFTAIATDAGAAFSYLIATHGKYVDLTAAITADRAVALGTTSAIAGDTVRFTRAATATGAFNWNIGTGPLVALSTAGSWADITFSGSAWYLSNVGTFAPAAGSGDLLAANNLSDLASAATARTNLGLTANGSSLVTAANYAAMRTLLDLEAGTDFYSISAANAAFQAIDPQLSSTIPINSKSAAYTLLLTDGAKCIFHPAADTTARIWTIPANASVAFPVGTVINFDNEFGAGAITIAITTDTLELIGAAGSTGSRTLATGGSATIKKVGTTKWRISGQELT